MKDISVVIKNLLGGVDAKQVRKVATVVTDAMSTVCGEKYVMIPASQLSEAQKSKAVKRPKGTPRPQPGDKRFDDPDAHDALLMGSTFEFGWRESRVASD